jgi:hypothetical protein
LSSVLPGGGVVPQSSTDCSHVGRFALSKIAAVAVSM